MKPVQYPLVVERNNYRLTYEWECPRDAETTVIQDDEDLVCAKCGYLAFPKLVSKVKIDPTIPDPEPDDIPF